jgi:tRNA (cytidine/uridine-2'-O-)-methyltransferase
MEEVGVWLSSVWCASAVRHGVAIVSQQPVGTTSGVQWRLERHTECAFYIGLTSHLPLGISNLVKYEPCLHVVLHQPEIPYNTGSVGRTCVAVGAKLWLVRPLGFRVDDYYLRRAGLDYWEHLEWEVVDDWASLEEQLAGGRFWFFTKTATQLYSDVRYEKGDVFVFGGESSGLPKSMLDANAERTLRIPIRNEVRSLNLSNAAAVAMYEAVRQLGRRNDE